MVSAPARQPRWTRRKDVRPSEITAAALEVFVEKGFAATRLDDVAARANVSKGTVYLYFESKEELFKAVVREGLIPAIAEGEKRVAAHRGGAADLIRDLVQGWWQLIGSTPYGGLPKLMISESRNFPEIARFYYEEVITRAHRLLRDAVQRGIRSGEFRKMDLDTAQFLVFSPFIMFLVWQHSLACCEEKHLDPEAYVAEAIELVLRGLAAPEAPSRNKDKVTR
jgi:AcrR family transcriptional regulator